MGCGSGRRRAYGPRTKIYEKGSLVVLKRIYRSAIAVALLPVLVNAWGAIGHMTVAYVAYQKLTPASKARISELLKLNPDYLSWDNQVPVGTSQEDHDQMIFVMASIWADDIKSEPQYSDDGSAGGNVPDGPDSARNIGYTDLLRHKYWHFINLPFAQDGSKLPEVPTPNAETQIEAFRVVLKSNQPQALKSYDLVWLLHLIGDIHQPLHATARISSLDPAGDAGGNNVKLLGDASSNLHAYWDDLPGIDCQFCKNKANCVERAVLLSKRLKSAPRKAAINLMTAAWAQQSLDQARRVVYQAPIGTSDGPFTIAPTSAYDLRAERLARRNLALAGARLAEVLNQELK
jgi:hypothetical protein